MSLAVSVVTVVRNGAATIADCILSVRSQTVEAEHVIVDGLSTDGTLDVVEGLRHERLRLVSERDAGLYDAMNKGWRLSSGEVVAILNADDLYASPEVLERVAKVFSDRDVDACYGDLVYVEAANPNRITRYWRAGRYRPESFYWGWMPPHPAFFLRRRVYQTLGGFRLELGSAADYEMMLRCLLKERRRAAYIPDVLVKMRVGGVSNSTVRNRLRANRMDRLAWKVNGLRPYPWTLWVKPLRKVGQFFRRPSGQGVAGESASRSSVCRGAGQENRWENPCG